MTSGIKPSRRIGRPSWIIGAVSGPGVEAFIGIANAAVRLCRSAFTSYRRWAGAVGPGIRLAASCLGSHCVRCLPRFLLLHSGRTLVSIGALPTLLFPLTAAGLALWSWRLCIETPQRHEQGVSDPLECERACALPATCGPGWGSLCCEEPRRGREHARL
jgi:hypothetical protein